MDAAERQTPPTRDPAPRREALVVDDSTMQRRILRGSLERWGYAVREAASGGEALEMCRARPPDMILSDWMMPGMTGPDFCRAFRALDTGRYGYFILLTSKTGAREVAHGLESGADDFLSKPVNSHELRARITAGERILRMERELVEKNRVITDALAEIQALYRAFDHDLIEARKLQQSLLRERSRDFGTAAVALSLRPSGHVGGDLVGTIPVGTERAGLFAIDVSGHGIAAAMMTARLAGYLSGSEPGLNVALRDAGGGRLTLAPPAEVAATLNRLVLKEMETDQYFTFCFADADLRTGAVRLVQAGHPHPMVQRRGGAVERIGGGGLPVGLVDGAAWDEVALRLAPGERLLIGSDGITECTGAGGMLGEEGLIRFLKANAGMSGPALLEALMWELVNFTGGGDPGDDVSAILYEFRGG